MIDVMLRAEVAHMDHDDCTVYGRRGASRPHKREFTELRAATQAPKPLLRWPTKTPHAQRESSALDARARQLDLSFCPLLGEPGHENSVQTRCTERPQNKTISSCVNRDAHPPAGPSAAAGPKRLATKSMNRQVISLDCRLGGEGR